jgi:hypothetical protein
MPEGEIFSALGQGVEQRAHHLVGDLEHGGVGLVGKRGGLGIDDGCGQVVLACSYLPALGRFSPAPGAVTFTTRCAALANWAALAFSPAVARRWR